MVGLINRAVYIKDRNHQHCQGNYSLYLKDGSLFGSSKSYSGYSQQSIPVGSVVRAVRDRLAGTSISLDVQPFTSMRLKHFRYYLVLCQWY